MLHHLRRIWGKLRRLKILEPHTDKVEIIEHASASINGMSAKILIEQIREEIGKEAVIAQQEALEELLEEEEMARREEIAEIETRSQEKAG